MMPGGAKEAWDALKPALESIAAHSKHGPCVAYVGPDGAGHFVKMVHNGIEYADMQLIAEVYDDAARAFGYDAARIAETFDAWNQGPLDSFLLELSAQVLRVRDDKTGAPLVDKVLDVAGQKGTGKWSAQIALDLAVPIPTINAAIDARLLSTLKAERVAAAALFTGPEADRRRGAARGDAARALRGQAVLVRAGHGAHRRRLARVQVEREPGGDGAHLEGRLHHSRAPARGRHARVRASAPT